MDYGATYALRGTGEPASVIDQALSVRAAVNDFPAWRCNARRCAANCRSDPARAMVRSGLSSGLWPSSEQYLKQVRAAENGRRKNNAPGARGTRRGRGTCTLRGGGEPAAIAAPATPSKQLVCHTWQGYCSPEWQRPQARLGPMADAARGHKVSWIGSREQDNELRDAPRRRGLGRWPCVRAASTRGRWVGFSCACAGSHSYPRRADSCICRDPTAAWAASSPSHPRKLHDLRHGPWPSKDIR